MAPSTTTGPSSRRALVIFGLLSFNASPTTLVNEAGASYLIESDSGIDNYLGETHVAIINAGLISKTAGTGNAAIDISGLLNNTGTIEADSGALYLAPSSIGRVVRHTFDRRHLERIDGAAIYFLGIATITSNAGTLAMSGDHAAIIGIARVNGNVSNELTSLATNSGSLTLADRGQPSCDQPDQPDHLYQQWRLGARRRQYVHRQWQLHPVCHRTLNDQIGGTPASGLCGRLVVTRAASLAGNFNVSLVNGFTPSRGTVYPALTFASASGTFATVTGLSPYFTEQLYPTSLELVIGTGQPRGPAAQRVSAPTTATTGQQITVNWQVSQPEQAAANQQLAGQRLPLDHADDHVQLHLARQRDAEQRPGRRRFVQRQSDRGLARRCRPAITTSWCRSTASTSADPNRANNTLAAGDRPARRRLPALTLGTPHDSFTAADQDNTTRSPCRPAGR